MRRLPLRWMKLAILAGVMASSAAQADGGTTDGGFSIQSGEFSIHLGGWIQLDTSYMDDVYLGDGVTDDSRSKSEIRRTRFNATGSLPNGWNYRLDWDIAQLAAKINERSDVGLRDAYLYWISDNNWVQLKLGNIKEPYSLEQLTNDKFITTIERSFVTDLYSPAWRQGILLFGHGEGANDNHNITYALGGFVNAPFVQSSDREDTYSVTGRLSYGLRFDVDSRYFHADLALSNRNTNTSNPGGDDGVLTTRLEVNTAENLPIVDFGIPGQGGDTFSSEQRWNIGAALVWDRWSIQGEYNDSALNGSSDTPDYDTSGYYVLGSVFLTGEHRVYSRSGGVFDAGVPIRPSGAWEIWLRYSDADLDDNGRGSEPSVASTGVNWYINHKVRLHLAYMYGDLDNNLDVDGESEDDGNAVTFRAHIWW